MQPKAKKLTLIIGAGASKEFGLPTGAELKNQIAKLLNIRFENGFQQSSGDYDICEALRITVKQEIPTGRDINPYLAAAWRICDALPQAISIDNFLDAHQGEKKMELCGKLAIVKTILAAERRSILCVNPAAGRERLSYPEIDTSWLNSFFKVISENCRVDGLTDRVSEISLVIFNYDRCVEHYLYYAFQNYYGISAEQAKDLLNRVDIYHPYGVVGRLPWQVGGAGDVSFGAELNASRLLSASSGIKTFTEGMDSDSPEVTALRNSISTSQRVLFLGFAFHRLNMQLIRPSSPAGGRDKSRRFFATAKGISDADCSLIQNEIANLWGLGMDAVEMRNDLVCREIFPEYTRSLSML